MSFNEEFSKAYRKFVDEEGVPDGLEDRIMASIKTASDKPHAKAARVKRHASRFHRPLPVAVASACAALAIVVAVPIALSFLGSVEPEASSNDNATTNQIIGPFLEESNFSIKAYAAKRENPIIMPGEENLVFFDPNGSAGSYTFWLDENGKRVNANFLTSTFTVEGEDIERIQMAVSKGELYGQTNQIFDTREHPELEVRDDEIDDPRLRGNLKGYEKYDALGDIPIKAPDDPPWQESIQNIFRMKRIGKVVDAKVSEDSRVGTDQIQFGFLEFLDNDAGERKVLSYEEMVDGDGRRLNNDAVRYKTEIDGAILTVTVTFKDGKHKTQVIELHDGVLACDDDCKLIEPARFFDASKGDIAGQLILYGTLLRTTDEPFPYSDMKANEYAFEVMPTVPKYIDPVPDDDEVPDISEMVQDMIGKEE